MKRPHPISPVVFVVLLSAFGTLPAVAQTPGKDTAVPDAPRFTINRFDVSGGTLLKPEEIDKLVAPYVGAGKDFGDIQRALQAIEGAYHKLGYGSVQVQLPEQDITSGVVRLTVVEQHIRNITIEGNQYFNNANVLNSLPSLKSGALPNSGDLSRNLQMLEEHPVKHTAVLLKSNDDDNQVDATVKIEDSKPVRYFASIDNTGNDDTGAWRTGFGFQHTNLFNRDHVLTVQYLTSPGNFGDVKIFGAGYHEPLYKYNSSVDLIAGYADVNSGTLQNLFNVSGSGTILGAHFNYYLPKFGDYSHKLTLAQDYRAYKNDVILTGLPGAGTLVPDVTVAPTGLTYSGLWRMSDAEFSFFVGVAENFIDMNDGHDANFKLSRADAGDDYRIWRFGANYIEKLRKDWQFRAALNGQLTNDALVSGEQFGLGGANSVRGFGERELADDQGFGVNLELYTPDFGNKLHWGDGMQARALVFYDTGYVRRNDPQPGEIKSDSIASIGAGVRFDINKQFSLRADYGYILNPIATPNSEDKGDSRLHAAATYIFD